MNSFNALGRITFIDTTTTATTSVCKFSLAIKRRGQKGAEEKTDFIPCVAFGKTAENISRFFEKGNRILIEGSLQSNKYEKDGKTNTSYNVVVNSFHFIEKAGSVESQETAGDVPPPPFDI